MIVVVLLALAGCLLLGVALDTLREHAQRADDREHERSRHAELMSELRRQP